MEVDPLGIGMERPRRSCSDGTRRKERSSGKNKKNEEAVRVLLVTGIRAGGNWKPERNQRIAAWDTTASVLAFLGSIHR
jgi:hypothetical protein